MLRGRLPFRGPLLLAELRPRTDHQSGHLPGAGVEGEGAPVSTSPSGPDMDSVSPNFKSGPQ